MGTNRRIQRKLKFFLFLVGLLNPLSAFAANESPQTFTLDGQLFRAGTSTPLLDSAVKIKVQILNPAATCLLYEEEQTTNTTTSDGRFTIYVGSATGAAKRTVNDPGRTMTQIFQNMSSVSANSVPGQTCAGGLYSPLLGDIRYFRLIVTPSASNAPNTLTPDIVMDTVPQALVAQSVQGLERTGILQVNTSGSTALNQANLEAAFTTPAYANLQSILAGNFIKTDASGAALPAYASNPAGVSNGEIWFDSTTGEIKYKNAAGVQVVGASAGGGGISSLTVGSSMSVNGTVAGTISSAGTIDLSNTGVSSGTYTKVTVDTKGRVTAGTISLVEADIPNLTVAGKVSGNTITSGTISGSAAINSSGNLITTGTVSGLTVQATNLRVYNGTNYIQFVAPTLAGIVNFTLPDNDGNPGDVLTSNGSGVLSWAAGTTTLAGDVSGPSGTTSVDKIKGKAITAGSVSGQMMIYDGTAWNNAVMSGDATLAYTGILSLNKVPVAKGGTNASSFGNNHIIASNGTGSAFVDFTCSLNNVITFDASGNAACGNVATLSGAIINGGNTTGADISIGTNDTKALNIKANNLIAMTISQSGSVGIGTTAPTSQLHNKKTDTSTSGAIVLFKNQLDANPSASSTASFTSFNNKLNQNTNSTGALTGIDNYVGVIKDATTVIVNSNFAMIQSLANVTSLYGSKSYLDNFGSGTIDSAYGFHSSIVKDSAGPITNAYGVYSDIATTLGAPPGNAYGIYTGPIQGATKYSFYASDISAPSFFAGSIGIGTSTPTSALDVNGAMTAQGISTAPAVSPTNTGRIYYDYSANKFKVSQNGAAYVDLVPGAGTILNGGNTTGADISVGTNDNKAINFKVNNTTAMTISQSGSIGIGTSSPSALLNVTKSGVGILDVTGTGGNEGLYVATITNNGTGQTGTLSVTNSSTGLPRALQATASGAGNIGYAAQIVNNSAAGWGVYASGTSPNYFAGSVGIGATAPAEKLEVSGAVKLGTTTGTNAGTIRWDGTNFQGYNGSAWANFVPNPPASGACGSTNTYTVAGTYTYTVPASFGTITIRIWGGGGAGGSINTNASGAGGNSSIVSLGLVAGGGTAGQAVTSGNATVAGAGGTASGGTINTNGANGATPSGGLSGFGGSSPNGGTGGTSVGSNASGVSGSVPGGGGSGGSYTGGPAAAAGGGAGAYVEKTYTTSTLLPGTAITDIIVGAGGLYFPTGINGGSGGVGRVSIACSTTGAPAANDRGVVFLSSGQHETDANFIFTASGNLGIGTPSPDEKLVVSNGTTTGKYTTSGWTHSSDVRLKHDIQPLQDSLNKILQLQGVEYKFNADPSERKQVGFIAQQVEPVFPEVVVTDDHGYKSMIYSNLVAPLVESVKSLYHSLKGVEETQKDQAREIAGKADQSEIEKLKIENQKKAQEIQDLKLRLEKLEKALSK